MAAFPVINTSHFESIARELGELVTGTQLDQSFALQGLADVSGQSAKWRRMRISLLTRQDGLHFSSRFNQIFHQIHRT